MEIDIATILESLSQIFIIKLPDPKFMFFDIVFAVFITTAGLLRGTVLMACFFLLRMASIYVIPMLCYALLQVSGYLF